LFGAGDYQFDKGSNKSNRRSFDSLEPRFAQRSVAQDDNVLME
jgi:hypothetical protein